MAEHSRGPARDDDADKRLAAALKGLKPKTRQSAAYKSDYIARHYDDLERAHRELHWSYKDLADFLTDQGHPTKLTTLKYNMRKLGEQRRSGQTKTQKDKS